MPPIQTKNHLCEHFSCVKDTVQEVDGSFTDFPKALAEEFEFQLFVLIDYSMENIREAT